MIQPRSSRSTRWTLRLILLNVCIGQAIVGLDQRALLVALPTLTKSFHTAFTNIQWTILIYDLILIGLVITMGRLGDLFGRRRFYSLGFLLFVIGSALCGIAQSAAQLILYRALQAIGGSMISANGRAIASVAFPHEERGKALGFASMAFHIGFLTGPSLGGFLIDTVGWRWIFYINVPIGIWGAYLAWKIIAETRAEEEKVAVDFLGAGFLLLANCLFIYAVDQLPRLGWRHPTVAVLLLLSMIALALLVFTETRAQIPILIVSLFRNRLFTAGILSLCLPHSVRNQLFIALLSAKPSRFFTLTSRLDYRRRFRDHHDYGACGRLAFGSLGIALAVHRGLQFGCHRTVPCRLVRTAILDLEHHGSFDAMGVGLGVI